MHNASLLRRKRVLSGQRSRDRIEAWMNQAAALDRLTVGQVLLEVQEGTWADKYYYIEDFIHPFYFHITLTQQVTVTIRLYPDYPGWFSVVHIG